MKARYLRRGWSPSRAAMVERAWKLFRARRSRPPRPHAGGELLAGAITDLGRDRQASGASGHRRQARGRGDRVARRRAVRGASLAVPDGELSRDFTSMFSTCAATSVPDLDLVLAGRERATSWRATPLGFPFTNTCPTAGPRRTVAAAVGGRGWRLRPSRRRAWRVGLRVDGGGGGLGGPALAASGFAGSPCRPPRRPRAGFGAH
jgi:hypothetical protein